MGREPPSRDDGWVRNTPDLSPLYGTMVVKKPGALCSVKISVFAASPEMFLAVRRARLGRKTDVILRA